MKRLISILLTMLLLGSISLQASATTQPSESPAEAPTQITTPPTTQPPTEAPEETTAPPATTASTEPPVEEPPENPPSEETSAPTTGPDTCKHSWVYVEVDPTCTEYGAKGYVCVNCEAVSEAEVIDLADHSYDHSCDSRCNACGAERSVSHKFSSAWSRNSTQHWHACSVCGEKGDVGGHFPGPAATEEKAQYCLTCGLMMMPKKAHTHKYSSVYTTDEQGHWYACEGCEERKDAEAHSYDDPCDAECNVCGHRSLKEHSYGSWMSDESGHWKICNRCGFATEVESHISGETEETAPQLCTVCDFELAAAPAHVHKPSNGWNSDEDSHWKLCECGEKMEKEVHSWELSEEIEEETMRYTCAVCGLDRTESAPEVDSGSSLAWWIPVLLAVLVCGVIILVVLIALGKKKEIF